MKPDKFERMAEKWVNKYGIAHTFGWHQARKLQLPSLAKLLRRVYRMGQKDEKSLAVGCLMGWDACTEVHFSTNKKRGDR